MRIRNSADYRTVLWVATAAALVVVQYVWPQSVLYVLPFSCYLGIACGVITHNHNHCPTFSGRRANNAFGHVLTFFYGYPTMMWIPTHNMNHHRFVNRPGDATITWRYTNKHNALVASTYFFVSSWFQSGPIKQYISRAKATNPHLYKRIRFQYVLWAMFYPAMLALAVALHFRQGMGFIVWFFSLIVPAVCSLSLIMFFNYIQHVHADGWSSQDHSRNFTGKVFNYLFFNNGYHTAHHDHQGLHWSALSAAHAKIADTIDPRLNETNLIWFLVRQYVLAVFSPRLGTRQIGSDPREAASDKLAVHELLSTQSSLLDPTEPISASEDLTAEAVEPASCTVG